MVGESLKSIESIMTVMVNIRLGLGQVDWRKCAARLTIRWTQDQFWQNSSGMVSIAVLVISL